MKAKREERTKEEKTGARVRLQSGTQCSGDDDDVDVGVVWGEARPSAFDLLLRLVRLPPQ